MLQAMNTGHEGSLSTAHANSARHLLWRLETMAMMSGVDLPAAHIRHQVASAVDVVIHLVRLRDGRRVIWEIAAVEGTHRGEPVVASLFKMHAPNDGAGCLRSDGLRAARRPVARRARRGRRRRSVRTGGGRVIALAAGLVGLAVLCGWQARQVARVERARRRMVGEDLDGYAGATVACRATRVGALDGRRRGRRGGSCGRRGVPPSASAAGVVVRRARDARAAANAKVVRDAQLADAVGVGRGRLAGGPLGAARPCLRGGRDALAARRDPSVARRARSTWGCPPSRPSTRGRPRWTPATRGCWRACSG